MKVSKWFGFLLACIFISKAYLYFDDLTRSAYDACAAIEENANLTDYQQTIFQEACGKHSLYDKASGWLLILAFITGTLAFFLFLPVAWNFFLARLREVSAAIRGDNKT